MAPPVAPSLRSKQNGAPKRKAQSVSFGEPTVHTVQKRSRDGDDNTPSSSVNRLDDAAYESDEDGDNRVQMRRGGPSDEGEESEHSKFSLAQEDIKIEPFNMNAERNDGSGYFDGDTFVFRRNNAAESDAWLDSIEDSEENQIYTGSASRKKTDDADMEETPTRAMSINQKASLCKTLARLLSDPKETVAKALRRYGDAQMKRGCKKKEQAWKKHRIKRVVAETVLTAVNDANSDAGPTSQETAAHSNFSQVSEIADALMVGGCNDIYELTQAKLYEMSEGMEDCLRKDDGADDSISTPAGSVGTINAPSATNGTSSLAQWEYRGNEDEKVHGPFTTEQMIAWRSAGFFVGDQAVDIRIVKAKASSLGKAQTNTSVADDLLADLESDEEESDYVARATSEGGTANAEGWLRSDSVNFSSYLLS